MEVPHEPQMDKEKTSRAEITRALMQKLLLAAVVFTCLQKREEGLRSLSHIYISLCVYFKYFDVRQVQRLTAVCDVLSVCLLMIMNRAMPVKPGRSGFEG